MINNNILRFEELLMKVKRKGIYNLIEYIRGSDMYTAPASSKYHLSCESGLLQHSLNVHEALKDILLYNYEKGAYVYYVNSVPVDYITEEGLIIVTLLHDLCKVNTYKPVEKCKKDNENEKYEKYNSYEIDDILPIGHAEKSLLMVSRYIDLTEKEIMAIRWHMGYTEPTENWKYINNCIEKYPIVWALHCADQMATHFMEGKNGNKKEFDLY